MHSLLAKRMCSGVHLNINLLSGRALTAVVIISAQMGLITPSHAQDASGSEEGQDGGEIVVQATRTGRSRSEEHTSELQSLMRISYAVFCLKKKKKKTKQNNKKEHRCKQDTK